MEFKVHQWMWTSAVKQHGPQSYQVWWFDLRLNMTPLLVCRYKYWVGFKYWPFWYTYLKDGHWKMIRKVTCRHCGLFGKTACWVTITTNHQLLVNAGIYGPINQILVNRFYFFETQTTIGQLVGSKTLTVATLEHYSRGKHAKCIVAYLHVAITRRGLPTVYTCCIRVGVLQGKAF